MNGFGIGVIVRSDCAEAKVGDYVLGFLSAFVSPRSRISFKLAGQILRSTRCSQTSQAGCSQFLIIATTCPGHTSSVSWEHQVCAVILIKNSKASDLVEYTGKTAYMGWKEYSKAKAGETVFISGGACS